MTATRKAKGDRNYTSARAYLNAPERFAETHDPEDLARQVPLKAKSTPPAEKPAPQPGNDD
ncbi:MAG: hypothetical protein ACFCVH_18515 [Alphaproteobacteria bacterium]